MPTMQGETIMLAMKKFANKTLTLTSLGLLFLSHTATAELQNIEAKSMPTQSQTIATNNITVRKVQFLSQGTKVVGNLYLPANIKAPQSAVVVVGPQSSVKEQVSTVYATQLANQGFVALTFDHRTFGESGGVPRQLENPEMKVEDIHSAVTFLQALPQVKQNAVALLGVCSGGGYSARAAATDSSINALVTVAGFYHDPQVMRQWLGDNYQARLEMGKAALIKYENTGKVDYMTNVDPKNTKVAMPGQEAYDYYGTSRGVRPGWVNRSAVMFFEPFLQFNAIDSGHEIKAPTLVIHSDTALVPDGARRFFKSINSNQKNLHWMNTSNHIAFYDQPEVVESAASKAATWLKQTLNKSSD
ncbi:alpha/beta hydrolase [Nostoc cf. edaphicum LEGE 07299]|uniref:Alpha/beta hydrolase n=1 Tax=Nostoc cf. edaphicum LEGE 07299 TaxID=2777974 RepID=A0ABR9TV06_9NOSO|nr:alpha/beta hydrolase [Nostoc edaphicum]MBE9104208.1 alpha/beta hydrolase [Nostoc cf. edaphicum LEGE 07299]